MEAIFKSFETKHADVALLYYSGHGMQIEGANYLVPVGAESLSNATFHDLIAVEEWVDRMSNMSKTRLIFFDACRNNPFAHGLAESVVRSRSPSAGANPLAILSKAGLAEVRAKADTFVAFAAAPGKVAYDGEGENSPFTKGLLRHIEATDLPIGNLMIRVR